MWLNVRPKLSGCCQSESEYGELPGFVVHRQFESVAEQVSQHQAHLVSGRIAVRPCLDVKAIVNDPLRQLWHQELKLITSQFVSEIYVCDQPNICSRKRASVSMILGYIHTRIDVGRVLFDGCNLEFLLASRLRPPIGNRSGRVARSRSLGFPYV